MASIDDRIVNMQFNNTQFQRGIAETNASLEQLKANLNLNGATSGIDAVQSAANKFSLQNMDNAVSSISSKFSIFGVAAFTVIQDLTNKVISAGASIGAALVDPIVNGGERRAEALQKAQFQFRGLGLDVQETMRVAKEAVLGTAFSLDQAATAAGQLGASGITAGAGLAEALRGIAGLAAQSGSSFDQVAQVFEKVAGNGRLMGVELLQLSSYGINAAAVLAKAMGTTESNIRDMVTKGEVSFQQFSDAMGAAFGDNAKKANELFSGALANMNAALARLGAEFEGPKLLNLRDIFNAMSPLIDKVHASLLPLINAFNVIQNGTAVNVVRAISELLGPGLVTSIDNIVSAIIVFYSIVKTAFEHIFPPDFEAQLSAVSEFFVKLSSAMIPTARVAGQLQRTFQGVFAVFDILGQIVSAVVTTFLDLLGVASPAGDSFLTISAKVGDFLVRVDELLRKGQFIQTFFKTLGQFVAAPIALIQTFIGIIGDAVQTMGLFSTSGAGLDAFSADVEKRFKGLIDLGNFFISVFKAVGDVVVAVYNFFKPVFAAIGNVVGNAVQSVQDSLKGLSFDEAIQGINTGLFAGFILIVRGFFGNLGGVLRGNGVAFVTTFKTIMTSLRVNLKALEINTNAKTLTQIAIAVALLAASAIALTLVDPVKLVISLQAIGGMMAALVGAFAAFSQVGGVKGIFEALAISAALTGIATAILVLTAAVAILGALPLPNLIQGVLGVIFIIGALTGAMLILGEVAPQVLLGAIAIALIAPALVLLTGAVAVLGAIPLPNLIQGFIGLVAIIVALVGAMLLLSLAGPEVILGAIAIALVAPAIAILTGAIAALSALPMQNLIQGVAAFVVVLAALAGGMLLLGLAGPEVLLGAVAIVAVSLAMVPLIGAIAALGALPLANLIQGMVAFTVALAILVGAVLLLGLTGPVALIGAVAIVAIALAIAVLAPALILLSTISWDGIGRLLTVLSAGLGILVVMGILLIPASVGFLLLGVAILLIGTGVILAATGLTLLATAIVALVAVGAAGIGLLTAGMAAFIAELPALGVGIAGALISMAVTIGEAAPQLITAFVQILLAMLAAIIIIVPKIVEAAVLIIVTLVNALIVLIPFLVDAGLQILEGILQGISDHIERITTLAILILAHFIQGLADGLPTLLQAGADYILAFINGVADTIRKNRQKFVDAALNIADAITGGLSTGLLNGASKVISAVTSLISNIPAAIKNILGIRSPARVAIDLMELVGDGMVIGLANSEAPVTTAAEGVGNAAVSGLKKSLSGIGDALTEGIDMAPTIKPIVDLSDIQNASKQIPGLLKAPTLSLDTTNGVAQSVSLQEQARNAQIVLDATKPSAPTKSDVNFTQNNYSPKALSTIEVYRQTNNQLSRLKGDLGVVDQSGSP